MSKPVYLPPIRGMVWNTQTNSLEAEKSLPPVEMPRSSFMVFPPRPRGRLFNFAALFGAVGNTIPQASDTGGAS